MATTIANNDYVIIDKNNLVISLFKGAELPEYNEKMINVIDITSLSEKPELTWTYNPKTKKFIAPAVGEFVIEEPATPELSSLQVIRNQYIEQLLSDFDYMGHTFNFQENTYLHMSAYAAFANLSGSLPDGFYWLDKYNNEVNMTLDEFTEFCKLTSDKVFTNFKTYVDKRKAL